jgi:hypothetical protein
MGANLWRHVEGGVGFREAISKSSVRLIEIINLTE